MSLTHDVRAGRHDCVVPANRPEIALTGHVVAGLLDAEGYFGIAEMNGGRSLSCEMRMAVRDDDVDLLFALARFTGIGVVRRIEVRGNPQCAWTVYRQDDAAGLVRLLDRCPLRSRKRHDFAVWRAAVDAWVATEPTRFDRMRELRRAIRDARTYRPPDETAPTTALESSGFDDWLAGFIAGDGSFGIHAGAVRLTIRLRADDADVLRGIASATGAGKVSGPYPNPGSNPVMNWNVCGTDDLLRVARRLEGRVPGRKVAEFAVWRRAAQARANGELSPAERRQLVDEAQREIRHLRRYRTPRTPVPSAKSRRGQQMFEQNLRWLALLRTWAEAESGVLSVMAYQRARRKGWPTRNTLASRFGSWYDVLTAAGLSDRAAVQPSQRDKRVAGGVQAREQRRQVQRERVLDAMRRCAASLGRLPGPTEYARWRFHNDPDAPAVATAYLLFPGGWSGLQGAAGS